MSASPRHPLVSIIVPTRNEAENIAPLVEQIVSSAAPFHEILFVDDDSTDGTRNAVRSLAASYPIRSIEQDRAEVGLAAAIMSGARAAQGEILLVMAADLSHPPERIKDLSAGTLHHRRLELSPPSNLWISTANGSMQRAPLPVER